MMAELLFCHHYICNYKYLFLLSWHSEVNPFQLWKELLIIVLIDVFFPVGAIQILNADAYRHCMNLLYADISSSCLTFILLARRKWTRTRNLAQQEVGAHACRYIANLVNSTPFYLNILHLFLALTGKT